MKGIYAATGGEEEGEGEGGWSSLSTILSEVFLSFLRSVRVGDKGMTDSLLILERMS